MNRRQFKRARRQWSANRRIAVLTAACASLFVCHIAFAQPAELPVNEPLRCDPTKVVGNEACAKCHESEVSQWKLTPHFRTFDTLHRTPEAKEIVKKLGLRSVKRNDTCVKCHYTQQQVGSRLRTVSGVSCESCHGAAADWVDLHADYGGPNVAAEAETPEHREQRRAASIVAGMNNPANVYLIAKQCYNCHTVPDESLVNVGGHLSGSGEFELVSWSQGTVRHNFVRSGGTANVPSPPARLRVMYVVGVMTDLEQSLRATARATENATFGRTTAARAARTKRRLQEIQSLIDSEHVDQALEAVARVKLTLGNGAAITAAADGVGSAAFKFASEVNGDDLAAIDPLLPGPSEYKQ